MADSRALRINQLLKKRYGAAKTALKHQSPMQLLVATILSAQCTDVRVNKVTPGLFKKYKTAKDFANANRKELEQEIRSTGFYRNKAKNIIASGKMVSEKFGGKVPKTMEEMLQLPGVARKTANIVLSSGYGIIEGIAVDTHVRRLSYRLGLTKHTDPDKIEQDLMKQLPKSEWDAFSLRLIDHGRKICNAKKPMCRECFFYDICPKNGVDRKFWGR